MIHAAELEVLTSYLEIPPEMVWPRDAQSGAAQMIKVRSGDEVQVVEIAAGETVQIVIGPVDAMSLPDEHKRQGERTS